MKTGFAADFSASRINFDWNKKVPIKTLEWYSTLRAIKFLKVTWEDGTVEVLGSDKSDGYQKVEAKGEDCFIRAEDNGSLGSVSTWNWYTAYGEEFIWQLPFIGGVGLTSYDFKKACGTGLYGKFNGFNIEYVGYYYDPDIVRQDTIGAIVGGVIGCLILCLLFYCCYKCCCAAEEKKETQQVSAG